MIGSASGVLQVLEPGQSDADKAAAYRAEIIPLLERVVEVVARAKKDGLTIGFNISPDQYGRPKVQAIDIVKPL
jgi:hypothetical protein